MEKKSPGNKNLSKNIGMGVLGAFLLLAPITALAQSPQPPLVGLTAANFELANKLYLPVVESQQRLEYGTPVTDAVYKFITDLGITVDTVGQITGADERVGDIDLLNKMLLRSQQYVLASLRVASADAGREVDPLYTRIGELIVDFIAGFPRTGSNYPTVAGGATTVITNNNPVHPKVGEQDQENRNSRLFNELAHMILSWPIETIRHQVGRDSPSVLRMLEEAHSQFFENKMSLIYPEFVPQKILKERIERQREAFGVVLPRNNQSFLRYMAHADLLKMLIPPTGQEYQMTHEALAALTASLMTKHGMAEYKILEAFDAILKHNGTIFDESTTDKGLILLNAVLSDLVTANLLENSKSDAEIPAGVSIHNFMVGQRVDGGDYDYITSIAFATNRVAGQPLENMQTLRMNGFGDGIRITARLNDGTVINVPHDFQPHPNDPNSIVMRLPHILDNIPGQGPIDIRTLDLVIETKFSTSAQDIGLPEQVFIQIVRLSDRYDDMFDSQDGSLYDAFVRNGREEIGRLNQIDSSTVHPVARNQKTQRPDLRNNGRLLVEQQFRRRNR